MTARDPFDRRLADALAAYAADALVDADPMRLAAEIAAEHPRRRLATLVRGWPGVNRPALWPVVILLLLAAAVGIALVGMRQPAPVQLTVEQGKPMPAELFGRWRADGSTGYLDLNELSLLHEADGTGIPGLGRAVAYVRTTAGELDGTIAFQASGSCGRGEYRVRIGSTLNMPDAASVQGRAISMTMEFLDPADPCAARRTILAGKVWRRVGVGLTAGQTYTSLDFTEPFHLRLSADAGIGLPNGVFGDTGIGLPNGATVATLTQFDARELHFSHPWWFATLIDDLPVFRDLCDRAAGTLPDIPGSVEAVGAWLASTEGLEVGTPTVLVIDGRRALRWQVHGSCADGHDPAASDVAVGADFFAVPTGDDVLLFVVVADTANEAQVARRVAVGIDFD